ncbi:hypothetical protein F2Q70_00045114 [Brassica cretica]|uniref:DUF4283 domain-containing protein n=1 Tax=Brassica cretica TaxID=69181 RepID=A0A8S9KI79_BRACR|nr:hypothetical protein F2Q70_00045114 [Brassica cretica]
MIHGMEADRLGLVAHPKRSLAGKFFTSLVPPSLDRTESSLRQQWKLSGSLKVLPLDKDNIILFEFEKKRDKKEVDKGGPWNVDGAILVLKECSQDISMVDLDFSVACFKVKVIGLPKFNYTEDDVEKIVKKLSDKPLISYKYNEFTRRFCVKVEIDLKKPLPPGFYINGNGRGPPFVQFKYKNLGEFCEHCGMINHRICGEAAKMRPLTRKFKTRVYGPWLRYDHKVLACNGLPVKLYYSQTIRNVDWESRLPVVLGPRKSRLSLFTREQQKLLDEARRMDGVPDLSALLKGMLKLLSKKSIPADVQGSTSSDAGRASKEGAPGLVDKDFGVEPPASSPKKKKRSKKSRRKTSEELPLEEVASLDETSEGLEARKEERGRKRPYEGATSSIDHGEAPAVGREGATRGSVESDRSEAASEDRPRRKKKKKSIEEEPRPSDVETGLVEVAAGGDVSLETLPKEREVSAQGIDPVTGERSIPDPSTRKGYRLEGSTVRRKKIEFPDRVEFSYNETTPLILNLLRCAELTRQIRGGKKEMP